VFTLLLTVILGVCIGAVAADLLFGPEQPATPIASSNGERWDPWRRWLQATRRLTRQRVGRGMALAARAVRSTLAALVDLLGRRPLQASRQALADLGAHRQARRQRHAAHARHVAHRTHLVPPRAAALRWADEDAPTLPEASGPPAGWPEPAAHPPAESDNGYGTATLPAWQGNGAAAPMPPPQAPPAEPDTTRPDLPDQRRNGTSAPPRRPAPTEAESDATVPAWTGEGVPAGAAVPRSPVARTTAADDPTLELAEADTAEMPVAAPSRSRGARTELAAPPLPVETARDVEPGEPGERAPLVVPVRERMRALAILSVLVCVFGVAMASVLLVVILTLTRAVGGV
jgi:hypothetical protein